jgi:small basic protein
MKPWAILISTLLVGVAIGVGSTILLPSAIEPYLVSALRAPRRPVEGQVIGKQREQGHVLLKVQTDGALVLATFTKKVPEIDLLVEQGDSITLGLANTGPFVDDPVIERVMRPRSSQPPDSGHPAPRK